MSFESSIHDNPSSHEAGRKRPEPESMGHPSTPVKSDLSGGTFFGLTSVMGWAGSLLHSPSHSTHAHTPEGSFLCDRDMHGLGCTAIEKP